jgi:carotenoid 1,2-hydratase
VHPHTASVQEFALDGAGRHRWGPMFPGARVEVDFSSPKMCWQGSAYVDGNRGDAPLEDDFLGWQWLRAPTHDGGTAILYDTDPRPAPGADARSLRLLIERDGSINPVQAPEPVALPSTAWRMTRSTHAQAPGGARVLRTLEDTPFYARSMLQTQLAGRTVEAMHESLSLTRFTHPLVQAMLPFRMPRAATRSGS